MLLKKQFISLSIALLFSTKLFSANALPEFTATYAVQKYGIKVAQAQYKLSHTETGYKFTQNTKLHGFASLFRDDSVVAVSYIDEVDGRLLLKKHDYTQTGKEKNRDESFSIQWNTSNLALKGQVSGVVRSKKIALNTTTPVWELLSFQVPLMIDANNTHKTYPYNAIIKGEIDTYNFELTSQNEITFADEVYKSLHMVRTDQNKDRQLHLWLAPDLHNIPVIIENYRDGKEHSRMQLESVQFNNGQVLSETESDDDF